MRKITMVLAVMALMFTGLFTVTSATSANADTISALCSVLNANLCITTQGTGNQVQLGSGTLFDLQASTICSGCYKIKVNNSTHCLTWQSSNQAVTSSDCQQGNGNQAWEWNNGGLRSTFNLENGFEYLGYFDPPASGKNIWGEGTMSGYDTGWVTP